MSLEELPVGDGGDKPLFETVNMLDARLCVNDSIKYAVEKSGQQVTSHIQNASSAGTSGVTFSVVTPSLSTVISRKVIISGTMYFRISNPTNNQWAVYPGCISLAPFAFQQMCSNITCTINNATFSFDSYNVLNEVLRCIDQDTLKEYSNYTPVQMDSYANYANCSQYIADPAGANNPWIPNPNWDSMVDSPFKASGSLVEDKYPRGTYRIRFGYTKGNNANIPPPAGQAMNPAGGGNASVAYIAIDFREPLVMSPFLLSANKDNSAGMYGVQALNFNFLLNSYSRGIRANLPTTSVLTFVDFEPYPKLEFEFLSPHPSVKLPTRNIVPYLQLQNFKTTYGSANVSAGAVILTSNTIQLSNIPDSCLLCVRPVVRDFTDADSYLPIKNVSINFNNSPGICSNLQREQLYECSKEAGVNMSWHEWCGTVQLLPTITAGTVVHLSGVQQAAITAATAAGAAAADFQAAFASLVGGVGGIVRTGLGVDPISITQPSSNAGTVNVATCGSLVKLEFGRHINIIQDWFAPGSITQANFQIAVTLDDSSPGAPVDIDYELNVIFFNSGMIVTSLGSTSSYVGLLTKENVLQASEKPVINKGEYERQYGGSWFSSLKSGISKGLKYAKPAASLARMALNQSSDPRARQAAAALGTMGAGYSAGSKLNGRIY